MAEALATGRTELTPEDEAAFQQWYRQWAAVARLNPDPDHPEHYYDYRGAWKAGAVPQFDPTDGRYHWPSGFKDDEHPNRFVNGRDTKRPPPPPSDRVEPQSFRSPVHQQASRGPLPAGQDAPSYPEAALEGAAGPRPPSAPMSIGDPQHRVRLTDWLEQVIRKGAGQFLDRARTETPGPPSFAGRMVPSVLSDIVPVHVQAERGYNYGTGPDVPRPMEGITPREADILRELQRIDDLLDEKTPPRVGWRT